MKKFEIKNTQYSTQILPSSSSPMASLERRSQSAVLFIEANDQPQNIGHAAIHRFGTSPKHI